MDLMGMITQTEDLSRGGGGSGHCKPESCIKPGVSLETIRPSN